MSTKGPLHYIPPSFSYILPVQSAATGVAIYAAVNKNGIPSTVFILVVVAVGSSKPDEKHWTAC